jgi:hypothetical protein
LGSPYVNEDIIVITSNAQGFSSCFQQGLDDFRVHLINPSSVPYSRDALDHMMLVRGTQTLHAEGAAHNTSTGNSLRGCLLDSTRHLDDEFNTHRGPSLSHIISCSKLRLDMGSISNASIKIHQSQDATIEEIVGNLTHPILLPGQTVSIAVRIKLKSLETRLSIGSSSPNRCCSPVSVVDAISELELALGNHLSELFELQVVYNHSFFPAGTRLEVRDSCWLPRILVPRIATDHDVPSPPHSHSLRNDPCVQKQVALCIAGSHTPSAALRKLERQFLRQNLSDGMSSFLNALKRRLKRQDVVFADIPFKDHELAIGVEAHSDPHTEETLHERTSHESTNERDTSSDDNGSSAPVTIVRRRVVPVIQSSTEIDEGEARRIWQQIRRTSRRGVHATFDQGTDDGWDASTEEKHEPYIEEIREIALKHGRKISSATLRSLAKDFLLHESNFGRESGQDSKVSGIN